MSGIKPRHYPDATPRCRQALAGANIFMPTEFLHGLYDGGRRRRAGRLLEALMGAAPRAAGGFLWSFIDEGVVRTDDRSDPSTPKATRRPTA